MNDMEGLDDLGADFTARLQAAAGAEPDLTAARAVLDRRVSRARRRRATAVTGSAGLSVLLLGAVFAMNTGDAGGRISSADAPPIESPVGSVTTLAVTTPRPGAASVDASDTGASPGTAEIAGSIPDVVAATGSSTTASLPGSDREELFDVTAAATEERTLVGTGGTVNVRVADGELSFASSPIATTGFTSAVTKDEPGELEVTFTSATHRTRLRVRLDGTRLRADRSEQARPSSAAPGSTTPDDRDDDNDNDDNDNDNDDNDDTDTDDAGTDDTHSDDQGDGSSGSSGSGGSGGSDVSGGSAGSGGSGGSGGAGD